MITKTNILKFLKDYCYAIYLGLFGLYAGGLLGALILFFVGCGFDMYISKRKKKLGKLLISPTDRKNIQWWKPKYNQDWKWFIYITMTIFLYRLFIDTLSTYDSLPVQDWFIFTSPLTSKMAIFFPLINVYAANMEVNNFASYHILMMKHILGMAVLLSIIFLPLLTQYYDKEMKYAKDVLLTNKSNPKESVTLRQFRLLFALVSLPLIVFLFLREYYFNFHNHSPTNMDELLRIITWEPLTFSALLSFIFFITAVFCSFFKFKFCKYNSK